MPSTQSNISDPPIKDEVVTGFLGGLNSFQDESLIKDSELTEARNILLSVDGLEPRPGTVQSFGSALDSRTYGGFPYYKSDGTREFLLMEGGKLYKRNGTGRTQIGSTTWNTSARVNFVQARDLVFIFNGVDALSYYNGSTITTYTALTTPVGLALATAGSAGTTSYSYRVSAFNATGETLACTNVTITTGNAILDATNYIKVSWTAVSGATGYNVWGNKTTGLGETYMATVYTAGTDAYLDKGQDLPSTAILPPEANTTAGIICSYAVFAQSRIFAAGDPSNKSRLYYSGVGSKITDFSFSETGGGATDIFKNDGAVIEDIIPFQGAVVVGKTNAIYRFSIATGTPTLEEITRSFGMIGFRASMHVENDIIFPTKKDGRLAFYSLGNQENYAAGIIRTNELSIKNSEDLRNVNLQYLSFSAGYYYNNLYICAIPTENSSVNDRLWILDTRFGAWVYWDGIECNWFSEFTETDGSQNLYYGSDDDGYVYEMFQDDRNDNGVAINVEWSTKSFNQKVFNKFKLYYSPTFQFKDVSVSGAVEGDIVIDGSLVESTFSVNSQTSGGSGIGAAMPGVLLPGDSPGGTPPVALTRDTIVEVDVSQQEARSIKYQFRSNTLNARFKFLSLAHSFEVLGDRYLDQDQRVYAS
jgi:hypothetical protein